MDFIREALVNKLSSQSRRGEQSARMRVLPGHEYQGSFACGGIYSGNDIHEAPRGVNEALGRGSTANGKPLGT